MTALPPILVAERIVALQRQFDDIGIAELLVTNPTNVRYLCGFTGSNGTLLVRSASVILFTDARYGERAIGELDAVRSEAEVEILGTRMLADVVRDASGGAVGLDPDHLSHRRFTDLMDGLDGIGLECSGAVERVRATKSEAEVARIRLAAQHADAVLAEALPMIVDRPAERDLALELDYRLRRRGADDVAYEPIVASGPNAAVPHHEPTGRPISEGDDLIIDVGAMVDGYRSDMTRTFCVGEPSPQQSERYELVCAAQLAGVRSVRAGVEAALVDRSCRSIIDEAGFGEQFVHGAGHGVGLDIHEEPAISSRSGALLADGNVITVEPGIYVEGVGGVRVEDTVLVTPTGAETLTAAPKAVQLPG